MSVRVHPSCCTRLTFLFQYRNLGAVYMIPEWLSFQNEFIPSPYISLYLFTWYRDEISSPHKSFQNEFIPVFNPNEILVLVWYFILASCKLKTNSVPRWKRKPCSLWRVAHAYRFQNGGQNGRFQNGWAGRFCHVNAVRTSFWNETHSGITLILVSCEQPLTWVSCKLDETVRFTFLLILTT